MQVQNIHYRTMGRRFRVTAVFTSDDAANRYMQEHPHEGVIASFGRQVFLADVRDVGTEAQERMDIWDHCEVCGRRQQSCWPVDVNALIEGPQHVKLLCDGCAAGDPASAKVIGMLQERDP